MTEADTHPDIHRVAIIDDDPEQAEITEMELERVGLETVTIVEGPFPDIGALIRRIDDEGADAAVCDNRLSPRGLATFLGAEALAIYFREFRRPAVLLTQFTGPDLLAIRKYREWLPAVLARDDATPQLVLDALNLAWSEIRGEVPPGRRVQRCLLDVEWVDASPAVRAVDVIIPQWRPKTAVRLPLGVIEDENIRNEVHTGMFLLANVNIDAENELDLFFSNVTVGEHPGDGASDLRR